jgi:superfamily I DNA/RNA helicase
MKSVVPEKALKELQTENLVSHLERSLSWINTTSTTERNSDSEITCVINTLNRLQHIASSQGSRKPSVMIICFYKEQKHLLKAKISEWLNNGNYLNEFDGKEGIQVHTVDSAQGKEADYVLLCFTKHHEDAFYNVSNRLNVALTRAKSKLVIFANHEFMSQIKSKPISELANQCVPFQGFK